jgi:hypothetical protein
VYQRYTKKKLVRDHSLNFWLIRVAYQGAAAELALALLVLRSQDVAQKRMSALHLPRPGFLEALGGAFMCFQFWHIDFQFSSQHSAVSTQHSALRSGRPTRWIR